MLKKNKLSNKKVTGYVKLGDGIDTCSPVDEGEMKEFLSKASPLAVALNVIPV